MMPNTREAPGSRRSFGPIDYRLGAADAYVYKRDSHMMQATDCRPPIDRRLAEGFNSLAATHPGRLDPAALQWFAALSVPPSADDDDRDARVG